MKTIRCPSVSISPHPEVGIECLLKYLSYLTCVSAGVSCYHNEWYWVTPLYQLLTPETRVLVAQSNSVRKLGSFENWDKLVQSAAIWARVTSGHKELDWVCNYCNGLCSNSSDSHNSAARFNTFDAVFSQNKSCLWFYRIWLKHCPCHQRVVLPMIGWVKDYCFDTRNVNS